MKKVFLILASIIVISCNNNSDYVPKIDTLKNFNTIEISKEPKYTDEDIKRRISVLQDIYKAGKNSITVTGANATSMTDLRAVIEHFDYAVKILDDTSISNKKLLASLKSTLIKTQTKEFPLLRKSYGKILGNQLWENNIKVKVSGSKIYLYGGIFASNKNIKDIQASIQEQIGNLRFKQIYYYWYDGASEGTYYDLSSYNDNEIKSTF